MTILLYFTVAAFAALCIETIKITDLKEEIMKGEKNND